MKGRPAVCVLDPAPLRHAMQVLEISYQELADRIGMTRRSLMRAAFRPMSPWRADHLACALGVNPVLIWGAAWNEAIPIDDELLELSA